MSGAAGIPAVHGGEEVNVETLPTGQAVRRFGELDPATTAAALHLTC